MDRPTTTFIAKGLNTACNCDTCLHRIANALLRAYQEGRLNGMKNPTNTLPHNNQKES